MEKLYRLWGRYGTSRNIKVLYIVGTLVALAVASGAPGAGSGAGFESILPKGFVLF
jgi:hypothetical protein